MSFFVVYFMTVVAILQRDTDKLVIRAELEELNVPPHVTENETRHKYPGHNRTKNNLLIQEFITRIDTLESDMTMNVAENAKALKDNSERLTKIEAVIVNESVVTDTNAILVTSN